MGNRYAGNKGLEYYKAYPRDFFEGTIGMTGQLRGFYRMVIDLIYMHDGFLLSDWGHIAGNTGFGKTQCKRMMQQLVEAEKIQLSGENGEFFTQKRVKSELKMGRKFQENQANKSAKRWKNKGLTDEPGMPEGIPDVSHHKTTRPQDLFHTEIVGGKFDEKTEIEPPKEKQKSERQGIIDALAEWSSTSAATSFFAYRTKIKKPITPTAAKRISTQLEAIFQNGGDPSDALGMCEERGWHGVNAEWYFNAKGKEDGSSNNNGQNYYYNGKQNNNQNGASSAHAVLIAGLAANADRYARSEGSDDDDDQIPL